MKYERADYETHNPFFDECETSLITFKLVTVRKEHDCMFPDYPGRFEDDRHVIKPGEMAVVEKGIVEGQWTSTYACIPCMDRFVAQSYGDDADYDDGDGEGEPADLTDPDFMP